VSRGKASNPFRTASPRRFGLDTRPPRFSFTINLKDLCNLPVTPAEQEPDGKRNIMITRDTQTDLLQAGRACRAFHGNIFTAGPRKLRQAIQAAVDTIEDDSLKRLWPNDAQPFAQTRAVLVLLTLCYARQIYSSTDAAMLVARDLHYFCLWEAELPGACVLRRFRTENREPIHHCLTAALHFLVEQKVSSGVVTKVNGSQLAEEANRRIITAAFVDSMEAVEGCVNDSPMDITFLFANSRARVH